MSTQGPQELSLRIGGRLLHASLNLNWKIESETLITSGSLSFKLPFKEKAEFKISGRDRASAKGNVHLESFEFLDGKGAFGKWLSVPDENKVSFHDNKKSFNFLLDDKFLRQPPLMSPGAIIFCLLRLKERESAGVYLGQNNLYETKYIKEIKEAQTTQIQILYAQAGKTELHRVASLSVDKDSNTLLGGEILLPLFGWIGLETP